jgi:hypothetical protein
MMMEILMKLLIYLEKTWRALSSCMPTRAKLNRLSRSSLILNRASTRILFRGPIQWNYSTGSLNQQGY